jgi:hypothetical protein
LPYALLHCTTFEVLICKVVTLGPQFLVKNLFQMVFDHFELCNKVLRSHHFAVTKEVLASRFQVQVGERGRCRRRPFCAQGLFEQRNDRVGHTGVGARRDIPNFPPRALCRDRHTRRLCHCLQRLHQELCHRRNNLFDDDDDDDDDGQRRRHHCENSLLDAALFSPRVSRNLSRTGEVRQIHT